MSNFEPVISACRYCRSYHLEGRRGGFCMQFGTPVQGCWKACSCAIPPFAPSWEVPVNISGELTQLLWQRSQDPAAITASGSTSVQGPEQPTIEVVGSCTSDPRSDTDTEMTKVAPAGATVSVNTVSVNTVSVNTVSVNIA